MPYGEKTKDQLLEYSKAAFRFFEEQRVKAVVMACNTTSAVVYDELKDKFDFKLYPLIQTVAKSISNMGYKRVGVFATPATVMSHAYKKALSGIDVAEIACPSWVKIVESNSLKTEFAKIEVEKYIKEMLKYNPDKIILGCTHYPYLIKELSACAPEDIFINPAQIYVNEIKKDLKHNGWVNSKISKGYDKFFASQNPEKFITSGKMFYDVKNCTLL